MTANKPFAEAALRNAEPILEILRRELAESVDVLEIGSGTGQHAVRFASALQHLHWQTSDLCENHDGIRAWIDESKLSNISYPIELDVSTARVPADSVDAVYSSNTAHIMSFHSVSSMFTLVARALRPGGVFCLYGPFKLDGRFTTDSNAAFDASLRSNNPAMGIRELSDLEKIARKSGLRCTSLYAVPSNNLVVVWKKTTSNLHE